MAKVLIIDDNDAIRDGLVALVQKLGHEALVARSGNDGVAAFISSPCDLVITDLKMSDGDGLFVLQELRRRDPDVVALLVTGFGSVPLAVTAMRTGAFDVLEKPLAPELLRKKIGEALAYRETVARRAPANLHSEGNQLVAIETDTWQRLGLWGNSPPMVAVLEAVAKAARSQSTVFIHGESGTGKELVARALHALGPRKAGPFVSVNCAAIPAELLEAELFGHERGAFTGATRRKLGRFELADGGTLFLDEIGDVPLEIQAKLLRCLQERRIERLGGEAPIDVDVRLVSATHRDVIGMVAEGLFREDLLYRLLIVPLELPPLRERREDIPLLVQHLLDKLQQRTRSEVKRVAASALAVLRAHSWPGNVRELENVLEQALVFSDGDVLEAKDLPPLGTVARRDDDDDRLPSEDDPRPLDEILEGLEAALIRRAYHASGRVKAETARRLGIKSSALYYKLDKYGIA